MNEFLHEAKKLMTSRETRHIINRKDRDKRQDYFDLGVMNDSHAWQIMLTLEESDECSGSPTLDHNGSGEMIYEYEKQMANGVWAYIKIKIKSAETKCIAISFHPVEVGPRKFIR
ncbi:hypothetical protein ABE504_24585 [Paenibacillus oryzisoli]|uniref:hypothetical protein n=1 Tax=Paenibacillus oryzisoli TaxID=1850517 RepID=UPI003D2B3244